MKTIKIASEVFGLNVSSIRPSFNYYFGHVGETIEMPESHAKKILRNSNFYISDKSVKKVEKVSQDKPHRPWIKELERIKGIGEKIAKDIVAVYPTKESLLGAIKDKAHIPFPDNAVKLLKKEFVR